MKNLGQEALMTNPELGKLFQEMELSVIALVQELEIVPPELSRYMEESILHPEKMGMMPPGMMPPGMMPPGMMPPQGMMPQGMLPPGTDPMAMLQFQQMQAQMNAMQAQMTKGKK